MIFNEREDDVENALNRNALWAITYGDLMSFLVVFFMMLSMFWMSRNVSVQMSMTAASEEFRKETKSVSRLFADRGLQKIARIELEESRMRIVLLEPVLFESGAAKLKRGSDWQLRVVAEALSALPNPIQVEGHTDDRPIAPGGRYTTNWELSSSRAYAVMEFLVEHGVPPERLSAIGYGQYKPVASNATLEGRSSNRRIEINLLRSS